MSNLISSNAKKFAKIIHAGVSKFEDLYTLKQRFEKELSVFSDQSKNDYLEALKRELKVLFEKHVNTCPKEDCPQKNTYQNASFLIQEELQQEKLSSFLENNIDYQQQVDLYSNKINTVSTFLNKEEFIKQEIDRVRNVYTKPAEINVIEGRLISEFNFTKYTQFAYEWLNSGQDWPLEQILSNARKQYLQEVQKIDNEAEFKNSVYSSLKKGVAWIRYENFLKEELEKIIKEKTQPSHAINLVVGDNYGQTIQIDNSNISNFKSKNEVRPTSISKQHIAARILSNPWVITIIGGLIIAFIANRFGWV